MPFAFTLVMMFLFSAIPAAVAWVVFQSQQVAVRRVLALIIGMTPLTIMGWTIFRHEGGNGDLDPLHFFYVMVVVSFVCSLAAVLAMEWRLRHK